MQNVITASEAKKITHGRKPLVPVEYEAACKALAACRTLDEAKYWNDKSDALAAWAKIYRDDKAGRQARALKLWAYRRMAELARELQPRKRLRAGYGTTPGPNALLREFGLSKAAASAASRLADQTEDVMHALANLPRPPSPISAMTGCSEFGRLPVKSSAGAHARAMCQHEGWHTFLIGLSAIERAIRNQNARELGRCVFSDVSSEMRRRINAITEWLDEFEQHLPKS